MIDNNERILESRIKDDTILNFVNYLYKEEKDAKFINILRAICICNGEPMIQNQKEISEMMIQDTKILDRLVYAIDLDPVEGIVVTFNFESTSRVSLDYLEKESHKDERIA